MDLLPRSHVDFAKEKYWEDFFSKLRTQTFEWYGEYDSLCEILHKYIRTTDKLLVIGCGNSKLSGDLYDVGFHSITNIDISATVVKQMTEKYCKKCPLMVFDRMDMLEMNYGDQAFNVVLDKGTLDAIMIDNSMETIETANKMFAEICRVVTFGGRYICISLLQEHILHQILTWFIDAGWMIRVNRCFEAEKTHANSSYSFPVFVVVCTKMKKMTNPLKFLEVAMDINNTVQRVSSETEVIENVKSIQHFVLLKHSLNKRKITDNDISLDLCCAKSGKLKYRLFIVDCDLEASLKYAVFIVPQGRECEWLFSSEKGRKECALNANCERLVVVHLLRDFQHKDLEEVKKDLSSIAMDFAPANLRSKVPFLSVGDDVGYRETRMKENSEFSGLIVVDDVKQGDNELYRQMIFLNKPYLIQSEAKLKRVKNRRKSTQVGELKVDFDYLACDHHATMVCGLAFLGPKLTSAKILQIGLGGGSLAMYLYKHFPSMNIEVVELDPCIVDIAKQWFGLEVSKRLSVHVADGIVFMQELAVKGDCTYDVVMIDVDNKDVSHGMSCPPAEFLSSSMLTIMSKLIGPSGMVVINCACRDADILQETVKKISSVFSSVFHRKIPNEVNDILFCFNLEPSACVIQSNALHECIKKNSNSNIIDVNTITKCIEKLEINH